MKKCLLFLVLCLLFLTPAASGCQVTIPHQNNKENTLLSTGISETINKGLQNNETTLSATEDTSGDWEYTDNGTAITIERYTGNATTVIIPSTINGKPVTFTSGDVFSGCGGLTSVTIPNSVTSIGNLTFYGCSSLTSINVESANSCYSSENGILYDKSRSTVLCYPEGKSGMFSIPNGITSVGDSAFSRCSNLTSVTIPSSVTLIGDWAFSDCSSLTSATIPNSVSSIGNGAYNGCKSLTSIDVESTNSYYSSENGILYDKYKSTIIYYPRGKSGAFTVPNSVTSFGDSAFRDCVSLTNLTMPSSITSISYEAFYGCSSLLSVAIPDSVTSIGKGAFSDCSSLTSVTISNRVTSITDWAFANCNSLTSIKIPNRVLSISNDAFSGCISLYDIYFSSAAPPEIGESAFKDVKAGARAIVPAGVTAYGTAGSMWNGLIITYGQKTELNASPTTSTILVNGKATAFEAYNIGGSNYFKLRDLAAALGGTAKQFAVGYDNSTKAIALTSTKPYEPVGGEIAKGDGKAKTATPTVSRIYLDCKELNLTVYMINNNNFFKLRDLMEAIDVYVGYDSQTKVITLDTSSGYIDE